MACCVACGAVFCLLWVVGGLFVGLIVVYLFVCLVWVTFVVLYLLGVVYLCWLWFVGLCSNVGCFVV